MPMTARLDGAELSALEISADLWQSVRETYRDRMLTMTCGERAIPKVSSRGLKYFAHHPKSGCDLHETGPESVEHHMTKAVLTNAARQAGWNADVEVVSPARDWIADVMISRGEQQIALEVQWSPQRTEDILARTRRYESSGVGCRWFLGPANHSRDVPGAYKISGEREFIKGSLLGAYGTYPHGSVMPLYDAAYRLFAGQMKPYVEARVEAMRLVYYLTKCHGGHCGKWMTRWYVQGVTLRTRCGSHANIFIDRTSHQWAVTSAGEEIVRPGHGNAGGPWWGAFATERVETVVQAQVAALLRDEDVPQPVRYEYAPTKQVPEGYVVARCPHCRATQGDSLLWKESPRERELTVPWQGAFPLDEAALARTHYCPDQGEGQCAPVPPLSGGRFPGAHRRWHTALVQA